MSEELQKIMSAMMDSSKDFWRAFEPALKAFSPQGFEAAVPTLPPEMLEAWFGKTFNREGLDAKTRLLVMLAGLTLWGGGEGVQMRLLLRQARAAGASAREIMEVIWQMGLFAGPQAVQKALDQAQVILAETEGTP